MVTDIADFGSRVVKTRVAPTKFATMVTHFSSRVVDYNISCHGTERGYVYC